MRFATICSLGLLMLFGTALAKKSNDSESMTVRGCLQRSRQNYMLVDRHGLQYVLKGVGDKLDREVGHEVEARGVLSEDQKSGERAEKQGSNPSDNVRSPDGATLEINDASKDVRKISDSCQ